MKYLTMILALILSGCATAPAERQNYWSPPSQPWTEEQSSRDKLNCQQLGISMDPRLGGNSGNYYVRCMLSKGYQIVQFADQ